MRKIYLVNCCCHINVICIYMFNNCFIYSNQIGSTFIKGVCDGDKLEVAG